MNTLKIAAVAFVISLSIASAQAQCGNCAVPPYSNGTLMCSSVIGYCGASVSADCDSNDKTPTESLDCKIAYWNKQLDDAKKRDDQAQKDIAHAQERIQAFTDARKGK